MSDFPDEIMVEIFSRLPTKSVGRCKCLSKSWNSHLSTSQFIKLHLTRKPHQENVILITQCHSLRSITLTPDSVYDNAVFTEKLDLQDTWTQVWGSCNGLVLLENEDGELYLMNPVTLQKVKIPEFDLALKRIETNVRVHGFGYDSFSDDYKIVTLSSYDTYGNNCDDTFVDVYSVKTGVWKRLGLFPYDVHPSPVCGAFVNGAIHWLAVANDLPVTVIPLFPLGYEHEEGVEEIQQGYSSESGLTSFIIAFNLASEVFYYVPPPCAINFRRNALVVLGGSLCLADAYSSNSRTDIWVMEDYDLDESWTRKFGPAGYEIWDSVKPLCFVGEDEVLLTTYEMYFMFHNVKEQTSRYLAVDGIYSYLVNCVSTFVESLVSVG